MPNQDVDLQTITTALNRLDDFMELGRSDLAAAPFVSRAIRAGHTGDSPFHRGRVLNTIIRTTIARSFRQRQSSPKGRDVPEWTILYLRFEEGKDLEEVSQMLNMPRRSVDRYYRRGKQMLLNELYSNPDIASLGFYCVHCGTMLADSLPGTDAVASCPRCQTLLDVRHADNGRLQLEAVLPRTPIVQQSTDTTEHETRTSTRHA